MIAMGYTDSHGRPELRMNPRIKLGLPVSALVAVDEEEPSAPVQDQPAVELVPDEAPRG